MKTFAAHCWLRLALLTSRAALALLATSGIANRAVAQSRTASVPVTVGRAVVPLTGPWKFHVGDDTHWAEPNFDDSSWENVDLTPPPGAHDDDVGLSGFVPGWGARGHAGYAGYAWYRLHISPNAPREMSLSLAGPPSVDNAYQIFLNGKRLGGSGDFTGATPIAYSAQPRLFSLPTSLGDNRDAVLAFRVWMGAWSLGDPTAGGIHIAPVLGERSAVTAQYKLQWLETFDGYIVEVVEALLFLLLACMGMSLKLFDNSDRAYSWFAVALVLIALYRANQAFFFWAQLETVHEFELFIVVLLFPSIAGAWLMAWRSWFRLSSRAWLPKAVGVLTLTYMCAEFLSRSWFHGAFPHALVAAFSAVIVVVRLSLLALLALIVYDGIRERGREGCYALPALLAIATGLFARELSYLHVRGIWFPFGTGVSRTQYAYAVFHVALAVLFVRRLRGYARRDGDASFRAVTAGRSP